MYTLHAFMCVIIMVYYVSEIEASSFAHKHKHYTRKSSPKAYRSMCNDDNVIEKTTATQWATEKKPTTTCVAYSKMPIWLPFIQRFLLVPFALLFNNYDSSDHNKNSIHYYLPWFYFSWLHVMQQQRHNNVYLKFILKTNSNGTNWMLANCN